VKYLYVILGADYILMYLIILFGLLLISFTIYWKYDEIEDFSFVDNVNKLNIWWRNLINELWMYFKAKDGVLYMQYGKDHAQYNDFVRSIKSPEEYIISHNMV
jgi:hypothetical protein